VDRVNVSKKAIKGPALVISPISSSMRQMSFMRQMMEERSKVNMYFNIDWTSKNVIAEFNILV
jgi:virulence-associated protein VagC